MGTKTDLEQYLELWDLFESEIKVSKRIKPNSLAGFAKYWETYNDPTEENDAKRVCDKLEKMRARKNGGVLEISCQSDRILNSKGQTDERGVQF